MPDRETVAKMPAFSVSPGNRRNVAPRRPKLAAFTGIVEADRGAHRKQRHTAKRILDRLLDKFGFAGGYTNQTV